MLLFNSHMKLLFVAVLFGVSFQTSVAQGGCSAIDKTMPPLFISFVQLDDKSWDGDKEVKGALLKLNNNSNCRISFSVAAGESRSSEASSPLVLRNGKLVRRDDVPIYSLNGKRISLSYLTKYPDAKYLVLGGFGGDVLETAYLYGGEHIFFGVPLRNFQRGGVILLAYNYDWDEGDRGQIITKQGEYTQRYETVEHYLRFEPRQLPKGTLK
jgi:hypothetical protein